MSFPYQSAWVPSDHCVHYRILLQVLVSSEFSTISVPHYNQNNLCFNYFTFPFTHFVYAESGHLQTENTEEKLTIRLGSQIGILPAWGEAWHQNWWHHWLAPQSQSHNTPEDGSQGPWQLVQQNWKRQTLYVTLQLILHGSLHTWISCWNICDAQFWCTTFTLFNNKQK